LLLLGGAAGKGCAGVEVQVLLDELDQVLVGGRLWWWLLGSSSHPPPGCCLGPCEVDHLPTLRPKRHLPLAALPVAAVRDAVLLAESVDGRSLAGREARREAQLH
jgi:hypothetical protein